MYISHENKAVNVNNMDSIEVAFREIHKDYIIQIKQRGLVELCIYSSGHMNFDEAKFVYQNILAAFNGVYYDTRKKRYAERAVSTGVLMADESTIDDIIKVYHEQIEKKENSSQ